MPQKAYRGISYRWGIKAKKEKTTETGWEISSNHFPDKKENKKSLRLGGVFLWLKFIYNCVYFSETP